MSVFFIALLAVSVLILIAVPGYLLINRKMISEECIPGFSKVLLFVCQPCLALFSFQNVEFSVKTLAKLGIFAALIIVLHAIMLGTAFLCLKNNRHI